MTEGISFEKELWKACCRLRGSIESSQYKHVVLGLLFLKFISDSYEEKREELVKKISDKKDKLYTENEEDKKYILNDKDRYDFFIPEKARWSFLKLNAGQTDLPKKVDDAMQLIENVNKQLLGGLCPKIYLRIRIPYDALGELINIFTKIEVGTKKGKENDTFGRVYEYFIKMFAMEEGRRGGEFYTPQSIVKLLVEILEPYKGRIFDPACGSGGMFVQSLKFVKAHKGKKTDISIYGQESIDATWRLCNWNLIFRKIEGHIELGNTYWNDKFSDLKADFILANPPFNDSEWKREDTDADKRWIYGTVPNSNANYAWIQHFITHLNNKGMAGFVLANGSLSVGGQEGEIRKKIIENDLVDCVVALPAQLFFTTQIPACLWFITKNKGKRKGQTLFIDAREMFIKISRTQVEFSDEQVQKIAKTVKKYRGELKGYKDIKGFCKKVKIKDVEKNNFILTPGRYVGFEDKEEENKELFEEKMQKLTAELAEQFVESEELQKKIKKNLRGIGFEF
ncbi:type I restriction-modification system subunit M [Candidatus Woesearchaeota archaeon]|nr:type I restriction-modification system subunit M [Candidatus Woesearchaeota archaeon]